MYVPHRWGQGRCVAWQSAFIRENWLSLGHAAWQGYQTQGRGLVLCDVQDPEQVTDWRYESVAFSLSFVPLGAISPHHPAPLAKDEFATLLDAVASYRVTSDLVLSLRSLSQPTQPLGCWLKDGKLTPPQCYQIVQACWLEFRGRAPHSFS